MGIEERLHVLEEEQQLVRGELKQTLVNVRDFLLELNLPALQEEEERKVHEHNEKHEGENSRPNQPLPERMEAAPAPAPAPAPPMPTSPPAPSFTPPAPQPIGQSMPPSITMVNRVGREAAPQPPSSFGRDDFSFGTEDIADPMEEFQSMGTIPEEENNENLDEAEIPDLPFSPKEPDWPPRDSMEYSDEPVWPSEDPDEQQLEEQDLRKENSGQMPDQGPVNSPARANTHPSHDLPVKTFVERSSQINLLTNLIRWVTIARKEIGMEYLPAFLDVYGIGDVIPEDFRQAILYLAETLSPKVRQTAEQPLPVQDETAAVGENEAATGTAIPAQPDTGSFEPDGEIWNRMILELHGILRCSDVRLEESQLPWKRNVPQADVPVPSPVHEDSLTETEEPATPEPEIPARQLAEIETEHNDEPEESDDIKIKPKNGHARKNGKKRTAAPEPTSARLRLILPVGDNRETEIDIGEFNLNVSQSIPD